MWYCDNKFLTQIYKSEICKSSKHSKNKKTNIIYISITPSIEYNDKKIKA